MKNYATRRTQAGDAILEALIGVLLMAIVGLGLAYTSARSINSQRTLNAQNIAIGEVRQQLQLTADPCDDETLEFTLASRPVAFTPDCTTETLRLSFSIGDELTDSELEDVRTLRSLGSSSSDTTRELFGGDGVVVISLQ